MQVTINDTAYEVPFDVTQITLGKFIAYQDEYGKDLDKKLKAILDKVFTGTAEEQELQRAAELEEHLNIEALCWYSYWTKYNLLDVKTHPFIPPLLEQYRVLRSLLKDENEINRDFPAEFEWKGEQWYITDYKLNPASDMTFNEIITSKEVMRQVHSIGGNKWNGMLYLCAVFCRKKCEPFMDALVQEGSERMEEFKELPLNHALAVAFFLSTCANTWKNILAFSAGGGLEIASLN